MTMDQAKPPAVGLGKARFISLVAASYMFLLIFRPAEYWEALADLQIEKVFTVIFVVAVAMTRHKAWHSSPVNISVALTMAVTLLCSMASAFPLNGLDAAYGFLRLMTLYYLLQMIIVDETALKEIALAFLIVTSVYMLKSSWEFFVNGRHFYRMGFMRMVGIDLTYGDPNSFAATAAYSAPLALALYKYFAHVKKFRIFIWGHFTLLLLVLVFTGSRSGQLTFAFFLIILILLGKRKLAKLTAMAAVAAALFFFAPEEYSNRFISAFDSSVGPANAAESADLRTQMFLQAMSLFARNPLTGTGPDTFHLHVPQGLKPHNLYGQILSETGILGGLAFVFFLWTVAAASLKALKNRDRNAARPPLTALLAAANLQTIALLLFNGMASHNFYRYHWLFIAALSVGCAHLCAPPKRRSRVKGGSDA